MIIEAISGSDGIPIFSNIRSFVCVIQGALLDSLVELTSYHRLTDLAGQSSCNSFP